MGADVSGQVTVHGLDRTGVYRWRIITDARPTAQYLVDDLGGTLSAEDNGWQIITPGPTLSVNLAVRSSGGLILNFAAVPDSAFVLLAPSWQAAHLCTRDVQALLQEIPGTALPSDLTVRPVDITTRGGRLVRYGLPELTVPVTVAL